jgi:hypothetical protein
MGVASKIPVRGGGTREAGGTGRLVPGGPGSKRQSLSKAERRLPSPRRYYFFFFLAETRYLPQFSQT